MAEFDSVSYMMGLKAAGGGGGGGSSAPAYDIVLELGLDEGEVSSITKIYMDENSVIQKAEEGKIVTSFVYVIDEYVAGVKRFTGWGSGVVYEIRDERLSALSIRTAPYGSTQPIYLAYEFSDHEWLLD